MHFPSRERFRLVENKLYALIKIVKLAPCLFSATPLLVAFIAEAERGSDISLISWKGVVLRLTPFFLYDIFVEIEQCI